MAEQKTISFPKIFNTSTGKTNMLSGRESINNCLYILLNSMSPELLGDPLYGSNILELSFEYEGQLLEELIRSKILNAVSLYERRISMTADDITFRYEYNEIIIEMNYFILSEGVSSSFSLAMQTAQNE